MRTRALLVAVAMLVSLLALLNLVVEHVHWDRGTSGQQLADWTQSSAFTRGAIRSRQVIRQSAAHANVNASQRVSRPAPVAVPIMRPGIQPKTEPQMAARAASAPSQRPPAPLRGPPPALAQVARRRPAAGTRNKYHVVVTSDGSVYAQWQTRVCYYHFAKLKAAAGNTDAGGFTRLLHSGKADGVMDEIPTVVVTDLPPNVSDGGYVVMHRPWGLLQWVREYAHTLPEDYILMSEPDHLFLRLPPLLASPTLAAAFPFHYITPKDHAKLIARYNMKNASLDDMAPIGNSPVMIHKEQLREICPIWYDLTIKFKRDPETDKAFGWIQEMYAFSVASAQLAAGPVTYRLHPEFMLQPPWDESFSVGGKPAFILHYTYGQDCNETTGLPLTDKVGSWHFDKRDYEWTYPPQDIALPKKCRAKAMVRIAEMINEASSRLVPWRFERGDR